MKMNIIGAGRVGKVFGTEFSKHAQIEIAGILNRSEESATLAACKIGSGKAIKNSSDFSAADLWMFSVSDDALQSVIEQHRGIDFSNSVVFHCSGALPSTIFSPLNASGIASVHPVMTFADSTIESLKGASFTIEGNEFALERLSKILTDIGGTIVKISSEKKLIYHSAMVMVSNYLTGIIYAGQELLTQSGFSEEQALRLINPLATEALKNCLALGPVKALTGPIQRGDVGIVKSELEILANNSLSEVYRVMGKVALEISSKAGLKSELREQLSQLLSSES